MFESQIGEWQQQVDSLPQLRSERSEYCHHIQSAYIDGVQIDDEPNYNTTVQLDRLANDEPGYPPIIGYTVVISFGSESPRLTMPPEAAVNMGRTLMLAGTAALRDKADNLGFLAGPEVWL